MEWNNEIDGFTHSQYYNNNGAGWNAGTGDQDIIDEWLNPETSARNAAIRERNAWLEQAQYNSPAAQMARMKAAGINPNTAAAGIAGSGNAPSASPVAQSQPQNPFTPVEAAAGLMSGLGSGAEGLANAAQTVQNLPWTKIQLQTNVLEGLSRIGLNDAYKSSFMMDLQYKPYMLAGNLARLRGEVRNIEEMGRVLRSERDLNIALASKSYQDILESEGRVDMMAWDKAQIQGNLGKLKAETDYINKKKAYLDSHNWYVEGGFPALLAGQIFDGVSTNNQGIVDNAMQLLWNYNHNQQDAISSAMVSNKITEMQANKDIQKELMKYGVIGQNQSKLISFLLKYAFGTGMSVGVGPFQMKNDNP